VNILNEKEINGLKQLWRIKYITYITYMTASNLYLPRFYANELLIL